MVTSNKLLDKKVVKMSEHNNGVVVPQRTLLGEVNEHITCPLCRGYYIDATTIVECLHSFCRSCIIKHLKVKSYCPVCEMMINSAKPNIKLDKALQDIVYKLVPGLFQKEMERRQQFYASRPGPAASATPEQRGEDTERVIFSPEDVISFSLEYSDATDTDSISSKSSDSNEPQPPPGPARRYLQCPAVVNISHLKKFLSMKFDIDSTQFAIDILYKRVPLPDYYTLMDIAYIYNWKRNEPMRFFYQIIDYIAIRNRLFDINRKSLDFRDRKSSPASTEDTNVNSPAINLNDQISEASSGTDSPMPGESNMKQPMENSDNHLSRQIKKIDMDDNNFLSSNKNEEDVEKSQFLNSFELTAKSNCLPLKTSPSKSSITEQLNTSDSTLKNQIPANKPEDKQLKRKTQTSSVTPELKKLKIELEKAKISNYVTGMPAAGLPSTTNSKVESGVKQKELEETPKSPLVSQPQITANPLSLQASQIKEVKPQQMLSTKQQVDALGAKRSAGHQQNNGSPKRKPNEAMQSVSTSAIAQKPITLQKPANPKLETPPSFTSPDPIQKPIVKKIPDLKPSIHMSQSIQPKAAPPVNKLRMDLLANNSDPTIDRSKILPQVKCSLGVSNPGQPSGDPLKSLFDSCKLNIPSSLSITLTDQKLESRGANELAATDSKKNIVNKNLTTASGNSTLKAPSPPVHNYIEILKLPDTDSKKIGKSEPSQENKNNFQNKTDTSNSQSKLNKPSETSAKGPIPNLKPISDTKLGKQTGNFASPITFQQTFEQQLQSMHSDKKSKLPKTKAQLPKLVPANPKSLSSVNKTTNPLNKPNTSSNTSPSENKGSTALDLSTAHNIQNQLSSQQTFDKTLETMQSIANLAKKQSLPSKGLPINMSQNIVSTNLNRLLPTGVSPLRIPNTSGLGQMKIEKPNLSSPQPQAGNRQDLPKTNPIKTMNSGNPTMSSSSSYNIPSHVSPSPAQPSPHSQTRSPSSSPKLVIAEEKQASASTSEQAINQSNQISSTQLSGVNMPKSESPKSSPGPSKLSPKPINKPLQPGKMAGIWQPMPPNLKPNTLINNPADYFSRQYLPKSMDINSANNWFRTQRQFEFLKSMSNMAHQTQNDFTNKEKQ